MRYSYSISKLFLSLSLVMFCLLAQAAPMQMYVSNSEGVHPETGENSYEVLNPSGEIDVTFIRGGLQISFKNQKGETITHRIFEDFRKKEVGPEEDQRRYRFERIKYEMSKARGISVVRGYFEYLSNLSKEKQVPAILFLNPQGEAGFTRFDHVFSNVFLIVVGSGNNPISFEDIVYNFLRPAISQVVDESFRAEIPSKNPVGFLWDTSAIKVVAPVFSVKVESQCARLFAEKSN